MYMHELVKNKTSLDEELSYVERTRIITCYGYPFGMHVSLTYMHMRAQETLELAHMHQVAFELYHSYVPDFVFSQLLILDGQQQ